MMIALGQKQDLLRIDGALADIEISPEQNQTGRCAFGLYDSDDKTRIGSIRYDRLQTQNAKAGVFSTSACRVAVIQNLNLDLNESIFLSENPKDASAGAESLNTKAEEWKAGFLKTLWLKNLEDSSVMVQFPDFGRIAEVRIEDFLCRVMQKPDNVLLSIQSKRAAFEPLKTTKITLRGHVVITSPARTLETNNVLWDIKNQQFTSPGFYILRGDGMPIQGQNGFFNARLEKINHSQQNIISQGRP